MAPKDQTEFPAGSDACRAARTRCSIACRNYNLQPEDNPPERRVALYHAIIHSNSSLENTGCDQSMSNYAVVSPTDPGKHFGDMGAADFSAVPGSPPASPLSLMTGPVSGSCPDAAPLDPSSDCSNESTTSTAVSTAPSDSFSITITRRFPGQGAAPYIKPPLFMDYGTMVDIGTSTFINRNCKILDTPVRLVRIGERCLIGPDFSIYAVSHPLDYELRPPGGAPSFGLDVHIGDDCWIGGHVTVLGGVTIGDGCVIGANSLVTKDIPAYHLAYGSPARVIRRVSHKAQQPFSIMAWMSQVRSKLLSQRWFRSPFPSRKVIASVSTFVLGVSVCTAAAAFVIQNYIESTSAG